MTGSQVLPLRPMTVGELLDAAASLLRAWWKPMLAEAFFLALIEQIGMTALRMTSIPTGTDSFLYLTMQSSSFSWLWMWIGLSTETVIITLLGASAARAARSTLLGEPTGTWRALWRSPVPWGRVLGFIAIVAPIASIAAAMCGLPWLVVYAFTGLIVPVMVLENTRFGEAVGRGLKLAGRGGMRAAGVRMLGYLSWALVRLSIFCAAFSAADRIAEFAPLLRDNFWIMLGVIYLAVNTMGYAMMACLDAVTLIETRIRYEGLDIALNAARRAGVPPDLSPPRIVYGPIGGPHG
ncbi:hypothetical protein Afil01_10590 [Actinorhabdospora filicis]|uniref:Glycerophosphoryl diester phosphodiesterase membrane domain-containing protein n=1 Tax=Actinorhabdospora filicis TaxID=1785913 RepID=A0A9W6W1T5_9ACTN|nr:hypothetical protein [Actinorhabdospora filicis]GLZ76252.1 hypothetical protein Afil01_10590 [Actinorhabdospora filicis]